MVSTIKNVPLKEYAMNASLMLSTPRHSACLESELCANLLICERHVLF